MEFHWWEENDRRVSASSPHLGRKPQASPNFHMLSGGLKANRVVISGGLPFLFKKGGLALSLRKSVL